MLLRNWWTKLEVRGNHGFQVCLTTESPLDRQHGITFATDDSTDQGRKTFPSCPVHWIMQKNGAQQPKIYRHTRTFLKTRSTPTNGKEKAQVKEWMPEKENAVSDTSCS